MKYFINFEICALFIYVIVGVAFVFKKKLPLPTNKIFFLLWMSSFISTITNIATVVLPAGCHSGFYVAFMYIVNMTFFIFHNASMVLFTLYCVVLVRLNTKHYSYLTRLLVAAPFILEVLLILTTPVTHLIFYLDDSLAYYHGPLFYYLYASSVFYIFMSTFALVKFRAVLNRFLFDCMIFNMASVVCSLLIQCIAPRVLMEDFFISIILFMILTTIQSPSNIFEHTTQVFNRSTFNSTIEQILYRGDACSIIFIHLEDIQTLVSSLGILSVNNLSRTIAAFLNGIRANSVYNVKSNLFVMIVPKSDDSDAVANIISTIRNQFSGTWSANEIRVKLSVRFCVVSVPDDASSNDEIYNYADYLASAKKMSSDMISAADIDLGDEDRYNAVRDAVRKALQNHSLQVYYQPIFSTKNNRFTSAEALVRLNDENLGFISPEEFIPIAEECGYIVEIGDYVFENVCRFISENKLHDLGVEYIEVNLSVIQCMQTDLASKLIGIMQRYSVPSSMINLEITETAAMGFPAVVKENIFKLVAEGVSFSMDDFGTGYSNMLTLVNLPFIIIKIDKGIIWSAFKTEKARTALQGTLSMIDEMKLLCVAEGIETKDMSDELTSMGCAYMQGYYFSRPVPEKDYLEFLENL